VALQPLDDALRLRILGLEETPADPQLAAQGRERLTRAALAGVQRPLAIPDQRLRQRAQLRQAVADPIQEVGRLLREDERAGAGARVGQAANDDVAAPRLAAADRDLARRLPEIELAEHTGPVPRPLEGALTLEERSHLAQVVVEDRLAADVALLLEQLANPLARKPGIRTQQPVHFLA